MFRKTHEDPLLQAADRSCSLADDLGLHLCELHEVRDSFGREKGGEMGGA